MLQGESRDEGGAVIELTPAQRAELVRLSLAPCDMDRPTARGRIQTVLLNIGYAVVDDGWCRITDYGCEYLVAPEHRPALTVRQREVLDVITAHLATHGIPPTLREICAAIGTSSTNGAQDHLRALQRKGFVTIDPMHARGIRLTDAPRSVAAPPVVNHANELVAFRAVVAALPKCRVCKAPATRWVIDNAPRGDADEYRCDGCSPASTRYTLRDLEWATALRALPRS